MIYDHVIYVTQGHVTFEHFEPTGGMARRARFRAFRANRRDGSTSLKTTLYISSEDFPYGIFVFNSCCDPDY